MKLSEIKSLLSTMKTVEFVLENGDRVPAHFHITEVGLINKHFIDCGGTVRMESNINFQLWNANDLDHRLDPSKLLSIIELSESKLNLGDFEIEVEYQLSTIGKFGLNHNGSHFVLTNKQTACLADDHCGIPSEGLQVIGNVATQCCTPGGSCC